jgi:hypothetical protein
MLHASIPAAQAAPVPLGPRTPPAIAILAAAEHLLPHLEQGRPVDAATLRTAMEAAFGASDASGAWDWKTAYDACKAATVLFLRKYGRAVFRNATSPAARLSALVKILRLLPTHTRRSEEAETFQQFSTPLPLGFAALTAASLTRADRVLEPSAGTGLLAILAEIAGSTLILNELAETRADLLSSLFPAIPLTRFDAAQIDDHLDRSTTPSVVIMNPPFFGDGERHRTDGGRRLPPPRFSTRPHCRRRAAGRDHRRELLAPTSQHGATRSCACRRAGASCSPRRSRARSMPSTAPPSRRG